MPRGEGPTFLYEEEYWKVDVLSVAGVDEVGMGALAGPVVAAAVIFAPTIHIVGIRDSKQLQPHVRQSLVPQIQAQAVAWGIGEASVKEIETLNIRSASHLAMRRALEKLVVNPTVILLDGYTIHLHPTIPTVGIIKGDQKSITIAAASILAKEYRDRIMLDLDREYPAYGFADHKGYGTVAHRQSLQQFGASTHHRKGYRPVQEAVQSRHRAL